jgi:hypothetical protein
MNVRTVFGTLLAVLAIAGASLLGACGGGAKPEPEGVTKSPFTEVVASKLAAALGLDGHELLWETEDTSAWRDAQLFANRILGEIEAPSLEEMQITVLADETAGGERTVVVRVQAADVIADYGVSMQEVSGRWRVTAYEVAQIVEAGGR